MGVRLNADHSVRQSSGETFRLNGADVTVPAGDYVLVNSSGAAVGAVPRSVYEAAFSEFDDSQSGQDRTAEPEDTGHRPL